MRWEVLESLYADHHQTMKHVKTIQSLAKTKNHMHVLINLLRELAMYFKI